MHKNHEGYADPTAGIAISKVTRSEKNEKRRNGGAKMNQIYRGDIWKAEGANGKEMDVLVLATHGMYCSTLVLSPKAPEENPVEIVGRTLMYADAGKLGYTFYNRLISFVKSITDSNMEKVEYAIMDALRIEYVGDITDGCDKAEENPNDTTADMNDVSFDPSKECGVCCIKEVAQEPDIAAVAVDAVASNTATQEPMKSEADVRRDGRCKKEKLGYELQISRLTAERNMMENLYNDAVSKLMTM